MHDNHGRGIALEDAKLVEAKVEAAEHIGVGVDANQAALFDVEMAFVEGIDGLGNAVGGDGGQKAEPAGMNAQNGYLKAADVGNGIEQRAVAANAEHELDPAQ